MNAPIKTPWTTPPDEGQAIEIAKDVLWMRLPLPMALDHVNVFALRDADGWTIVDTGMNSRRSRAIWAALLDGPLAGLPVARVLLTHHHPDHVGLAGWFQTEHGAALLTSRTAWLYARMLTLDEQPEITAQALTFFIRAGLPEHLLERRRTERPFNFADMVAPLPVGFERLTEGQQITLAGRRWAVRMGGGHAPEHVTLWSMDDNLVIGGDQLLATISPNIGVYATEPNADPLTDWLTACRRFQPLAQDDQLVLPGHKQPFTGLPTRLGQLIENHESALARLLVHLATPKTAQDCLNTLFKRDIKDSEHGHAIVESLAHLNHLWHQGRVTRVLGPDGAWLWQTC
jgi:glyoxylase-like metal-dependent hydrolase (beta-lactamase superfamily II)